ncbi:MAG: S-layer homology domain-containing protein [Oscillospiraceae bacterium]
MVTGFLAAALLLSAVPAYAVSRGTAIKDIADSSGYAAQSILSLAGMGIVCGDENGNFHPKAEMTRAEATKILVLSLGLEIKEPAEPTFQDVSADNWAYAYIETAYQAKIVNGVGSGRFDPNGKCTREQLAKMLVNSLELTESAFSIDDPEYSGLSAFQDSDQISDWARDAVSVAVYAGIMLGTGDAFLPDSFATKEQMAVVADRFIENAMDTRAELDTISNTQITAVANRFVFAFSEPVENFSIRSITDQNGERKKGEVSVNYDTSTDYHKWISMGGEYVRVEAFYSPRPIGDEDELIAGETYHVKYSFSYNNGEAKTIYCEKDVTILPNSAHVESVIPLNLNQIWVGFSDSMTTESAGDPDNYRILDENGNALSIESVEDSGLEDTTDFVVLNLSEPVTERAKLTVSVKENILRFFDSEQILPYSYMVVLSDRNAPEIEQVVWNNDGTSFTSVTVYFSEPVASGTVLIDNAPVGNASGKAVTISGLRLDGSASHQLNVQNVSDGVNTDESSPLYGVARLYDPPKAETGPPAIKQVDLTKDENGRLVSFTITYDENLLQSIPTGHIYAYDENGNSIFTLQWVLDTEGNPVSSYEIFCTSTVLPVDNRKAVFTIAEGVDIYGGQYKLVLPAGLVTDENYNASLQETITLDF